MQSIAITVALALLGLGNSTGQENGSVSGRAVLRDGSLARGVTVTATAGSVRRRVVTGVSGDFRLDSLPPDSYRIEGDLEGFRTAVEAITVSAGAEAEVTLVMRLGISGDIDYVLPADGLRGALRAADVVVHLRIITSLGSGLLGPDETLLATQHAATVLRVIKGPQPSVAAG